jgi:hypothetical protein
MCRCEPLRSSGYGHMADGIGAGKRFTEPLAPGFRWLTVPGEQRVRPPEDQWRWTVWPRHGPRDPRAVAPNRPMRSSWPPACYARSPPESPGTGGLCPRCPVSGPRVSWEQFRGLCHWPGKSACLDTLGRPDAAAPILVLLPCFLCLPSGRRTAALALPGDLLCRNPAGELSGVRVLCPGSAVGSWRCGCGPVRARSRSPARRAGRRAAGRLSRPGDAVSSPAGRPPPDPV